MSNLFLTLVIAFVIIVLAIASLAIGWLITGKTKLERGACGRDPTQKKDDSCQSACHLCSDSQAESIPPPEEPNVQDEGAAPAIGSPSSQTINFPAQGAPSDSSASSDSSSEN